MKLQQMEKLKMLILNWPNQGNKAIQFYEYRRRNFQIDEAYLLLGKARYYDQRFIPALDAFNYIL
jgi:hypothetical protein